MFPIVNFEPKCNYSIVQIFPKIDGFLDLSWAKSHYPYQFGCVFSDVSYNCSHHMMHSHIGCICETFLHCVFSNVSLNGLPERMQTRIGCICLSFLHCGFLNVSSNGQPGKMQSRIGCICLAFLRCGFSNVSSNYLP